MHLSVCRDRAVNTVPPELCPEAQPFPEDRPEGTGSQQLGPWEVESCPVGDSDSQPETPHVSLPSWVLACGWQGVQ